MKTVKTLTMAAIATLLSFTAVTYSSCSKIECVGKTCQHGGSCNKGKCSCPSNYEGDNCENGINKKFAGTFTGNSDCAGPGTQFTFAASPTNPTQVFMQGPSTTLNCTVSGNSLTIPYQTYYSGGDQVSVQGSGTLNGNSITIYLAASDLTTGDFETCNFTGTK